MFELYKDVKKENVKTQFGVIAIKNVKFDSKDIQNVVKELVFEDNNLKFMFQENDLSDKKKSLILKRFLPNELNSDINEFIDNSISKNKTFYSFLAEGILGLVFRDLYKFDLSVGIIDINQTLNDTHTGADACMFDKTKNILILGEAKFYKVFKYGMKAVIDDFLKKSIFNKLDSFKRKIENNDNSYNVVIKNLKQSNQYGKSYNISLSEFLDQKIIFAGFVLHGNEIEMKKYLSDNFYDCFKVSVEDLINNIKKDVKKEFNNPDYEIFLFHLPINDKKELIKEVIDMARLKYDLIMGDD